MLKDVEILLSGNFEQVDAQFPHLICQIYSKLYKDGKVVRNCISSRQNYFREIQLTGLKRLEIMEQKRTFKAKKSRGEGLTRIYDHKRPHVIINNLSDSEVIDYLKAGIM